MKPLRVALGIRRAALLGMISSRASVFVVAVSAAALTACVDGQTYTFDDSGSYTGDGVLSVGTTSAAGDAGSNGGSVIPMPAATLSFDGAGALTLWPTCTVRVTRTGTESTQDQHDTNVRKANGSDFQVTDTYDQAYDYTLEPDQSCAAGPDGDSEMYVVGSGTVRFTVDGVRAR